MNNNNVSQAEFMLFIPSCTLDMKNNVISATYVVHPTVNFTCEK
jgi:hypothetical protein